MTKFIGGFIAFEAKIQKRAEKYGFSRAFGLVSREEAQEALASITGVKNPLPRLVAMALATNRIAYDRAAVEIRDELVREDSDE